MHILVVSQYFWPENFRINDLVEEWCLRGHEVTVLTGVPNYPSGEVFAEYAAAPQNFKDFAGARVVRVPMSSRGVGGLRLLWNYVSFVLGAVIFGPWRLRGCKPDVIFVFEPSPVTVGLPAILLGRIKRAPVVFWALDLWPETLQALGVIRSRMMLRAISRLVRFIYDNCTLVLGQSRGFLGGLARHCSDPRKIRYFPSWSENLFSDDNTMPAAEIPVREDCFNVVFAGNIGEAQDMPAVLHAAELLRNELRVRWIIIGDGRKFDWLKSEVNRRHLQDLVLLPGRFPVERMPSFFAHADALLVCLKRDPIFCLTIPGKVQAYLLAGKPLLGMLDGEGAEIINEAKAGLTCSAGNSAGLAKALSKLASMSADDLDVLGVNGRAYAEQNFDRSRLLDTLDGLLLEAIAIHVKANGTSGAE